MIEFSSAILAIVIGLMMIRFRTVMATASAGPRRNEAGDQVVPAPVIRWFGRAILVVGILFVATGIYNLVAAIAG